MTLNFLEFYGAYAAVKFDRGSSFDEWDIHNAYGKYLDGNFYDTETIHNKALELKAEYPNTCV